MENYIEIEKEIAGQSIKAIEQISEKAQEDLQNRSSIPYAAVNNTFTDTALIEKINIEIHKRNSFSILLRISLLLVEF